MRFSVRSTLQGPSRPYTRIVCLAVVFALHVAGSAHAGAWTQSPQGYFFKLSANYLNTKSEFDAGGNEIDMFATIEDENRTDGEFRDANVSAYLEYGILDGVTLIGQAAVKNVASRYVLVQDTGSRREFDGSTFGFGDFMAGLRYRIAARPVALALQGAVKLPVGYDAEPPAPEPPLGNGESDAEVRALAGYSFYPAPVYVTGGVGMRARGGDADNELLYDAEIGLATASFLAKISVDVVRSRGEIVTAGDFGAVTGEADYVKLLPGIAVRVAEEAWVTADVIHVMDGKNTLAGTTFSVGVAYSR